MISRFKQRISRHPAGTTAELARVLSDTPAAGFIEFPARAFLLDRPDTFDHPEIIDSADSFPKRFGNRHWLILVSREIRSHTTAVLEDNTLRELFSIAPFREEFESDSLLVLPTKPGMDDEALEHLLRHWTGELRCNWDNSKHCIIREDYGKISAGAIRLSPRGTRAYIRKWSYSDDELTAAYLLHKAAEAAWTNPEHFLRFDEDDIIDAITPYLLDPAGNVRKMSFGRIDFPDAEAIRILVDCDRSKVASLTRVMPDISGSVQVSRFSARLSQGAKLMGNWRQVYNYFGCPLPLGGTSRNKYPEAMLEAMESLGLYPILSGSAIRHLPGDENPFLFTRGYATALLADRNYFGGSPTSRLSWDEMSKIQVYAPLSAGEELPLLTHAMRNYGNEFDAMMAEASDLGVFSVYVSCKGCAPNGLQMSWTKNDFEDDESKPQNWVIAVMEEDPETLEGFRQLHSKTLLDCLAALGKIPFGGVLVAAMSEHRALAAKDEIAAGIGEGRATVAYDPEGILGTPVCRGLEDCLETDPVTHFAFLTSEAVGRYGENRIDEKVISASIISRRFFELVDGRPESDAARVDKDFLVNGQIISALSLGHSRFSDDGFPLPGTIRFSRDLAENALSRLDSPDAGAYAALAEEFLNLVICWKEINGWIPTLCGDAGDGFIRKMGEKLGIEPYLAAICRGISVDDII